MRRMRYIGWVRDAKGIVLHRPDRCVANAVTTNMGGHTDPYDGLANTSPHIVYEYE